MIVTFKSKAGANLIYTGDIAIKLLALMGRDDKVPSALYAEDVAAALTSLRLALDNTRQQGVIAQPNPDNKAIALSVRAQPLLDLLSKAQKKKCPVMWE